MFKKLALLMLVLLMGSNLVWAPTCEQKCDKDASTNTKGKKECKKQCEKVRKADKAYAKRNGM